MKSILEFNKGKALLSIFAVIIVLVIIAIRNYKSGPDNLPNIVIIVMDTARQDHLSCYGYEKNTTPNLNSLVKTSRMYYNAYSTSSWTNPAHASLFTGLYPIAHNTTQENVKMSEDVTTLAEVLKDAGYETYGIVENPALGKHRNFNQGFSQYYEAYRKKINSGNENKALFLFKQCIREMNRKKPFFIFINFIEPHNPYNSSRQFINHFISNPLIACQNNSWRRYYLGEKQFTQDELQHLTELYDAEILYVDYLIGKASDELIKSNLWENTVFIITSDHGENIGDHNHMNHVFSLYESTIKVPLIIHYPKLFSPNSKDYAPTQLTDIFTTVLRICGINSEAYPSQGFDLLENGSRKERPVFTEYYYPEQTIRCFEESKRNDPNLNKYKRRIRSITYDNKKLIWSSDGKYELYDLKEDPYEKDNLICKRIEVKKKKLTMLKNILKSYTPDKKIPSSEGNVIIDKETEESLRSLGYLP